MSGRKSPRNLEQLGFFRSLRGKLILWFLVIALLPLGLSGTLNYFEMSRSLRLDMIDKLSAIRDIKAKYIESYFKERLGDVRFLSQDPVTIEALQSFDGTFIADGAEEYDRENTGMQVYRNTYLGKPELTEGPDDSAYDRIHDRYHKIFKYYLETYGYYDIFLVEARNGNILYTVAKEDDFGTSLKNGPYAGSNIGKIFMRAVEAKERNSAFLEDFAYYEPSNEPAAFSAAPIFDGEKLLGALIFQLPVEQVNSAMQGSTGMGKTGETILIGSDDFLLRSDSRFSKESTLLKQKVDTAATRASAAGERGFKEIIDYRGEATLIAHTPLNIPGLNWSLNAKIDAAEAYAPIRESLFNTLLIALIGIILVLIAAFLVSAAIASPIKTLSRIAEGIAEGHLRQDVDIIRNDEIGVLARAFQKMGGNLRKVIEDASLVTLELSRGRLEITPEAEYKGDFTRLKASFIATANNLQRIINDVVRVSEGLADGRLDVAPHSEYSGDFERIRRALTTALPNLRDVITDIVTVSGGLADGDHEIRPHAEYRGDFNKIKRALTNTALNLAATAARDAAEDWLKNGQAGLVRRMSGEQSLAVLGRNIIQFSAGYAQLPMGVLFLLEGDAHDRENARLKLIASYAYTWRKGLANEFKIGQGLVGQAALERRSIIINDASEAFVPIQSGLGATVPRHIYVIPILHDGTLKGVLELAGFRKLEAVQLEFLEQAAAAAGVALNSAEARQRTQELLEQSQAQAEELASQSEELQSQNEEMESQAEELRQTNEELEERTKELERRQDAIRQQNLELEQARSAIETKAKELEVASKYKSEFLANMSHELRTPLNSLLILSQLLSNNKEGNLSQKQIDSARTIHSAGSDLLKLINEILDLSKVEAGKIELNVEDISLNRLRESAEEKFRHMAENKGLEFNIEIAGDIPSTLRNDGQRLQQVINNLISNAFKFTDKGGRVSLSIHRPAADCDLSRSGLNPAESIAVSVTDTGIGIPEDKQMVIFEAFQQADGTTSRKYGGTGLGLSISRQLAQLMGGEIQLRSEPGKGTTFTVYLPMHLEKAETPSLSAPQRKQSPAPVFAHKPAQKETLDTAAREKASETPPLPTLDDDREQLRQDTKSILIVEDDADFARILMDLAREQGFQCLYAADGASGLGLAAEYQPKAVILDIGLPQIDGWSVMEHLKDNPATRHIPVHFISGADEQRDAKRMGAIGFLLKPVNMGQLDKAFERIETFIADTVKNLLLIADNAQHQKEIKDLLGSSGIVIHTVKNQKQVEKALKENSFDCIILDIHLQRDSGIKLLQKLQKQDDLVDIPVILYAERELSEDEEKTVQQCDNLIIKEVHSRERLLDETTLFLHQVESDLSKEQQKMLRMAHDKEAILSGKKILLVDDDMRNIFALASVLEEKNMEVFIAENGHRALEILDGDEAVDMVLMDIMMPEMDGYEAMQKIRAQQRFRKLPIIALTAKAMKGDRTKCIEAGANDYLSKPIDSDKLLSLMRVWLYR